jgi:DNA-binding transcriptional regulator LsrR (DeoR family)
MDENTRLLVKVAKLYYENGLTQDEVSQRLRISRPKVSRLLQEARNQGVVQITIASVPGGYADLERQLESRYDLMEALVVATGDPGSAAPVARDLGQAAAGFFRRTVQDGDVVGLTWGATLAGMVDHLQPEKKQRVVVAQMVGGLGQPSSETHATDLARRVSQALDATLSLLPAPGIVDTVEGARLLRSDRHIAQSLEMAGKANLAFVGIGAPGTDSVLVRDESIISRSEVRDLVAQGAVGDIGLHFYDLHGHPVPSSVEDRVIGVGLDVIRALPRVVGIAGGAGKFDAVLGALRGKFINTLITDMDTAHALLDRQD